MPSISPMSKPAKFFFQAEDGIRDWSVTGVQTCALPISHEGGLRFKKDSEEYEILSRWIAQGMPNDLASAPKLERIVVAPQEKVLIEPATEVQLRVQALFTDEIGRASCRERV